jgi:hypothetical protein
MPGANEETEPGRPGGKPPHREVFRIAGFL